MALFANGKTETRAKEEEGPVELNFMNYFGSQKEIFQEYVDRFNAEYEGKIHVTSSLVPRDELMKQYTIGAVSGELPDMGMVDSPDHNAYASMGVLADITDLFNNWDEANFLEGPMNSCTYENRIYGIPYSCNDIALCYDEDLFEEYDIEVPETWEDLEKVCAKLTDASIGRYGLAMSALANEEGTFQLIPWIESAGKFDELDSEGSKKALTFLKGLVDKGYMSKEIINWSQADVEKQFASGNTAMMINGSWEIPRITEDAPDLNWSIALIPRASDGKHASALGGENFVICKGSNTEACWTFLTWFLGKKVISDYDSRTMEMSARSDVNPDDIYPNSPKMALFAKILPSAVARGPHPRWPEISAAVYTAEQEVLTGQKSVDDAMKAAQQKIDKINSEQ
jgi:multiple sugar transport system substrate-binding protein